MAGRRRILILGIAISVGFALLAALAIWQYSRSLERADAIALAEQRLQLTPSALPDSPGPDAHALLPVRVRGRLEHENEQRVLASTQELGPGFRAIVPFEVEGGRRILVDRGIVPFRIQDSGKRRQESGGAFVEISGVLTWPRERGYFTPERDQESGLWFARDVPGLSQAANTEPVLLVARESGPGGWPRADPPALDRANIHIEYMLTWISLSLAWLVIGGILMRREHRQSMQT